MSDKSTKAVSRERPEWRLEGLIVWLAAAISTVAGGALLIAGLSDLTLGVATLLAAGFVAGSALIAAMFKRSRGQHGS